MWNIDRIILWLYIYILDLWVNSLRRSINIFFTLYLSFFPVNLIKGRNLWLCEVKSREWVQTKSDGVSKESSLISGHYVGEKRYYSINNQKNVEISSVNTINFLYFLSFPEQTPGFGEKKVLRFLRGRWTTANHTVRGRFDSGFTPVTFQPPQMSLLIHFNCLLILNSKIKQI